MAEPMRIMTGAGWVVVQAPDIHTRCRVCHCRVCHGTSVDKGATPAVHSERLWTLIVVILSGSLLCYASGAGS
jgi:hypothetical protein